MMAILHVFSSSNFVVIPSLETPVKRPLNERYSWDEPVDLDSENGQWCRFYIGVGNIIQNILT